MSFHSSCFKYCNIFEKAFYRHSGYKTVSVKHQTTQRFEPRGQHSLHFDKTQRLDSHQRTKLLFLYSTIMKFCSGLTAHQTADEDTAATTHCCSCIIQEQHTGRVCLLLTDGVRRSRRRDREDRTQDPALYLYPHTDVTVDDSFIFITEGLIRPSAQFRGAKRSCGTVRV